ncbi:phage tail protein [Cupriavidus sp. D384]|uniref:phage tail protein n=1 Tax=Cupriavidus sp. D384 TaxID=1538095 RepID=UPI00082D0551|nr:phage tail protein [Cupriavidus sp. D384]
MDAVDFFDDFEMIWATGGEIEQIARKDYREGWAYIGEVPPLLEQFNRVQQLIDQRTAWLFRQVKELARVYDFGLGAERIDALTQAFSRVRRYGPGQLVIVAGDAPPDGTLAMNGAAYSPAVYPELFNAIGTTYGGDGVATFHVPDVPDGYAVLSGAATTVGDRSAGAVISHFHPATTDSAGVHDHAAEVYACDPHQHEYVYSPAATHQDRQGASDGPSFLDLTQHARSLTSPAGAHRHAAIVRSGGGHAHVVRVASVGGQANLAAGVKFLFCIAY